MAMQGAGGEENRTREKASRLEDLKNYSRLLRVCVFPCNIVLFYCSATANHSGGN